MNLVTITFTRAKAEIKSFGSRVQGNPHARITWRGARGHTLHRLPRGESRDSNLTRQCQRATSGSTPNASLTVKRQPQLAQNIQNILALLCSDPFQARLKTHKLKGELKDSYACSAGYDLRIIFKFVEYEQTQAILLESIGTHDEVY